MKKDKIITFMLLAVSVALFVPTWGTFHGIVGVNNAWIAFISAAVFFASGHKLKDSVNIALSHLLGVGWGLSVLYLFKRPILTIDSTLYTFLVLMLFGFMSVVITNIGIFFISHTPSLFSGWAIAFAVFGNMTIETWHSNLIFEVLFACAVGVFFVGCGITQLHSLFVKLALKGTKNTVEDKSVKESKQVKEAISQQLSPADQKMSQYLHTYCTTELEEQNEIEEMQVLRHEMEKLRQQLLDVPLNIHGSKNLSENTKVKIIGICGSPHKKGSTIEYLKMAMSAAEEMGNVEVEIIELAGKEVKPCMGCKSDRCGGTCIISDYMQELYPKLRECDGLILASPSYFGTFSGQLKLFIDRLRVMRHSNFELGNVVIGTLAVAGRRHGGQEITNIDLIQSMMRHNTIIVNDGTAVCQLGATGWSHTFDDPSKKADTDDYGMQTAVGVGKRVAEIAKIIKASGIQNTVYAYNQKIGKR